MYKVTLTTSNRFFYAHFYSDLNALEIRLELAVKFQVKKLFSLLSMMAESFLSAHYPYKWGVATQH
jgi:hypothetical protein